MIGVMAVPTIHLRFPSSRTWRSCRRISSAFRMKFYPGQNPEQLALLSDGVIEPAKSAGELFVFDRTHHVSVKSACEIFEAAAGCGPAGC